MDVKNTFLNDGFTEEVYMKPILGIVILPLKSANFAVLYIGSSTHLVRGLQHSVLL